MNPRKMPDPVLATEKVKVNLTSRSSQCDLEGITAQQRGNSNQGVSGVLGIEEKRSNLHCKWKQEMNSEFHFGGRETM